MKWSKTPYSICLSVLSENGYPSYNNSDDIINNNAKTIHFNKYSFYIFNLNQFIIHLLNSSNTYSSIITKINMNYNSSNRKPASDVLTVSGMRLPRSGRRIGTQVRRMRLRLTDM